MRSVIEEPFLVFWGVLGGLGVGIGLALSLGVLLVVLSLNLGWRLVEVLPVSVGDHHEMVSGQAEDNDNEGHSGLLGTLHVGDAVSDFTALLRLLSGDLLLTVVSEVGIRSGTFVSLHHSEDVGADEPDAAGEEEVATVLVGVLTVEHVPEAEREEVGEQEDRVRLDGQNHEELKDEPVANEFDSLVDGCPTETQPLLFKHLLLFIIKLINQTTIDKK